MNELAKLNANNVLLLNMPETISRLKENEQELKRMLESREKDYEENFILNKNKMETLIQTSPSVTELRKSISHMHQLYDTVSVGITKASFDTAMRTSELETMPMEQVIEQSACGIGEQVKELQRQVDDLLTKSIVSAVTVSQAEQNNDIELRRSIQDMNDRLSQLEKQLAGRSKSSTIRNILSPSKNIDDTANIQSKSTTQISPPEQSVDKLEQSKLPAHPYPEKHNIRLGKENPAEIENLSDAVKTNVPISKGPIGNSIQKKAKSGRNR
ncbi:unnamed protein product [Rotaria magnacalcarata]|uniref:Uncharacterized protein n=1 Tax=Rotaria magnacalcarata TaxID=392030 RepID=A0A815PUZ5_9BILA|nr:unnamed protein product [Rotaria magnacalcarata]CAF1596447.1 unnamed protein product [Rotaria magnacalcarata]CAF2128527.1 unnamed protein product [Rotaria magnacalcarata]CAF4048163.1 unnamed protein product [Rotaria magnacalcarata]CAF4058121.1 unnamed protein product [Rotaria magnacalcarata]